MNSNFTNNSNNIKKIDSSLNSSNKLFKPIIINQDLLKKSENNITSTNNGAFPISTIIKEQSIPIIYPQFQLGPSSKLLSFFYQEDPNKKYIDTKNKPCCSCNKTKCIKKYCECFANSKYCTNCICLDCRNKEIYMNNLYKDDKANNKEITFCTCSKSGCNKKYCDCYKANLKCNIKCRCVNCLNCEETKNINNNNNENNKIISLEETKSDSANKSLNNDVNNYCIQRISILINNNQTLINVEKLSLNEINLLGKKRNKN